MFTSACRRNTRSPLTRHALVALDRDLLALFFDQNFKKSGGFTRQIHGRKNRWMQLDAAGIGARNSQQVIDQRGEAIHFLQHAADRVAIFLAAPVLLKRDLADASDRGQRRPQFVRSIGSKTPELLEGLFQTRQQTVEYTRKVPEFVVTSPMGRRSCRRSDVICFGPAGHFLSGASARLASK